MQKQTCNNTQHDLDIGGVGRTLVNSANLFSELSFPRGGSVAEWSACWTQAQKGLGSNRSRDNVG